jgi:hypothetical protein
MEKLISLQCNFSETLSCKIFGEAMGSHLFDKFVKAEDNILYFYNSLDKINRKILINYIQD